MDKIDVILTRVVTKVEQSALSDAEKADVFARLHVGMRSLVWPTLISHIPKEKLKSIMSSSMLSIAQYMDLIESSLQDPATPKAIHDEIESALREVEIVVDSYLTSFKPTSAS